MSWEPLVYVITPRNPERSVLRAQLLGADYNVAGFHGADEALSRLQDEVPHIIIVDGAHAREAEGSFPALMQRLSDAQPLPVLHIVDLDQAEVAPEGLREGCDDTLIRPVRSLELLTRVASLLRNRQLLGQVHLQEKFLESRDIRPSTGDGSRPTVLLVEDESAQLETIGRILEEIPCEVIKARNPSDALWHVKRRPPQLVIVDLLFPDLDGLELCRYLKLQDSTRYTPLLMLTSMPELDNRVVGMDSGPDDYLVKPVNSLEVVTRVRRLLHRNRSHRRLLGNSLLLNRHGFTDPSSGIPRQDFFRFVYPEMVRWAQKARLPFTVARIRLSSEESFLKVAGVIRSTLRNFDLDFITGDTDLSLILPETPSDRARIALSRILARAEEAGVPPWDVRLVTVSIGENGWERGSIQDVLLTGAEEPSGAASTPEPGQRIVIAGESARGRDLAQLLSDGGFDNVGLLPLEEGHRGPGRIRAGLVVLQGDTREMPGLVRRLMPALPSPDTPLLIKYTDTDGGAAGRGIPDQADYIPPGAADDYLFHRVRSALDTARLRSGGEEIESFLKRLVRLLEEGDVDVQGHGQKVSNWAVALGSRMGLAGEDLDALRWGGLLHDVGKIFLPGRIVAKEGMLTAEEFTVVKSHPRLGHDLCSAFSMLAASLPVIKHHHERMDGKGYPEGLKGDKIPLAARVVTVVDIYDTLRRRRPYRPAFSDAESAGILRSEARSGMWDPGVVEEFLKMIEK